VWPVPTFPTVAARDALSASTAWSWSAAMSWLLRSIASCWRVATWAGPFTASAPSSAWPSRTVVNGGSWIGWALGWLMPDDSIRALVASRSALSERFSGEIASGAPPSAPMAGGATVAGGVWTGVGWSAGVPAGGLLSGAYDPSTFWASDSILELRDWPASWATF